MRSFIVFLCVIIVVGISSLIAGCGGEEGPTSTCTEMVTDLYAIPNCAMWDVSHTQPSLMSASQALVGCRKTTIIVNNNCEQCSGLLRDYLNCRPTKCEWSESLQFYVADDCNDEMDRLLNCCS